MNLNERHIVNSIESYRRYRNLSQDVMAEMCGMTSKSIYSDWISGKTKGGKLVYFLEFIKNTNTDIEKFFNSFGKPNTLISNNNAEEPTSPNYKKCTNPQCMEEKLSLREQIVELKEKLIKLKEEKLQWLEEQEGASSPGKKVKGGVEETPRTGTHD